MIGFFIFDDAPSVDNQLVKAHLELNKGIEGLFYVRISDCKDVSSVKSGDKFFGILDDSSGYGACIFIVGLDVESNTLLLTNNLHVKGNQTVDGNSDIKGNQTITGNLDVTGNIKTGAMITGNSPNTTINLTAAHAALILAAGMSGTAAPLPSVPIIMSNS